VFQALEDELSVRLFDRRALTQPHLIDEWLMKNDFRPVVGHRFNLRADWGVVDCQVLAVEPNKTLSYTWGSWRDLSLEQVEDATSEIDVGQDSRFRCGRLNLGYERPAEAGL
jgi:uncharacterized protein YndB with AHSA1/START domain